MKKTIVSLIILFFSLGLFSQDRKIGGINMPGHVIVGKDKLILNGAGVREKYFVDMYVCGLYLKNKLSDPERIMLANEKMAFRLHIISGMVTNKRMQEAVRTGFEKSTHHNTAAIREKIEVIIQAFSEPIKQNDVYEIFYTPGHGSAIYKNGVKKAVIEGLYFKQALFGIWLGDNPAHKDLRGKLMGG